MRVRIHRKGHDPVAETHGTVFNIQRFSVHDGPGIRTTVFLKGCPLSCRWCHNPEGRDPRPEVAVLPEHCIGCGACREACPEDQARPLNRLRDPSGDNGRCVRCGACATVCPSGTRTLLGQEYSVDALADEIVKDRVFFEESGGGVTFSGGEPLAPGNIAFVHSMLERCGQMELHRAIDTTGFTTRDRLIGIATACDLILYDLKLMDDRLHRDFTGVSNQIILSNLRALDSVPTEVWIRVPVIPGVTRQFGNVEALAEFAASLGRARPICLLPYHKIGGDKYRRIGTEYTMNGIEPPTEDDMAAVAETLQRAGLRVRIGG